MHADYTAALEALLDRLRRIHAELARRNGGVAVLHTEAAVATLESHIRRQRAPAG